MAGIRQRYYLWLFKAYAKRMKRTIVGSLVIGILISFALLGLLNFYFRPLIQKTTENVGYAGAYTIQILPDEILNDISYGLTQVDTKGEIKPGAAESWTIEKNEIYTFKLKKGIHLHDGKELTADRLTYKFENVTSKVIDKYTIQYVLKDPYSPFLSAVSKPILTKKLDGIGRYEVKNIELNGGFVRTILLEQKDKNKKKKIFFYPTQKALKLAFILGEVDRIVGVTNLTMDKINLRDWKNVKIEDSINYSTLVSVFYNINDSVVGDKKVRQALNYALPAKIIYGIRAYSPIPPTSIYFETPPNYGISDIEIAKTILSTTKDPINKPLMISTTEEYEPVAKDIQKAWKALNINSTIKIVDSIPSDFQVLLYRFKLPKDPDQYVLWHSDQVNNITHYKNLRIDKLLEDGRSITNIDERRKIYADFQKYLTDDVPASFFYFPKAYTVYKD